MKAAIFTFSEQGANLARILAEGKDWDVFGKAFGRPVKRKDFASLWSQYDGFIFVGSVGITVRYIAEHIQRKDHDPAVCTINDGGDFVISVLSGHLGGANAWARELAKIIGGIPVITTASDSRGFQSIDLFAKEHGYVIEHLPDLTPVASAMVNGKTVAFFSEEDKILDYPNLKVVSSPEQAMACQYSIVVSHRVFEKGDFHTAHLKPKKLHLGLGARKNAPFRELEQLVQDTFREEKLSLLSIKDMASIDIKGEEPALLHFSELYHLPFYTFSAEDLKPFEEGLVLSDFVRKTVGVGSVSGSSARKLGGSFVVEKVARGGFTLSITIED